MTTDEKLQHFLDFCMEDSRARSAKMLDDYAPALEKTFEEHKASAPAPGEDADPGEKGKDQAGNQQRAVPGAAGDLKRSSAKSRKN